MKEMVITRKGFFKNQTVGELEIIDSDTKEVIFKCFTIELPWRNNARSKSCVPTGDYFIEERTSPRHGKHLILEGTSPRTYILIHTGNFFWQTAGCILVGSSLKDLNADGLPDLTDSKETLAQLLEAFKGGKLLTIKNYEPN